MTQLCNLVALCVLVWPIVLVRLGPLCPVQALVWGHAWHIIVLSLVPSLECVLSLSLCFETLAFAKGADRSFCEIPLFCLGLKVLLSETQVTPPQAGSFRTRALDDVESTPFKGAPWRAGVSLLLSCGWRLRFVTIFYVHLGGMPHQ